MLLLTDLDPYCDPCQLLAYGSNSSMTPPPPLILEPLPPSDPLPAPLTFLPFLSASVLWGHTYNDVYRIFGIPDFLPALPAFGPDLWYKVTYHV